MKETLFGVTVVFNPREYESRYRLYRQFAPYAEFSGLKLFTVEIAFKDRPFHVTRADNPYNLQLRSSDEMWHKERALKLGMERLLTLHPEAKKMIWIDADVRMANVNWVKDTLRALDHYDVVQLFSQAEQLSPNNESLGISGSVFYNYVNKIFPEKKIGSFKPYIAMGHPGLAWGATTDALNKLGGLLDFCIHGCYDEETEVYTQRGFIPFSQLSMEDKVLSRTLDEKVEWGDVVRLYKYPYVGDMYKIKSDSLDLLVTPNHNMVYRKISSDKIYFEKIENTKAGRKIPKVSVWNGLEPTDFELYGANSLENFVAFMGLWLSEGWTYLATEKESGSHHYRIGIAQNKKTNLLKIKNLLETTFNNIKWNDSKKHGQSQGFIGSNKELFTYLRQFGKQPDRFIPCAIKNLPTKYLKIFMEWFILGDGHIEKKKNKKHKDSIRVYTSSKTLRDDLMELAVKTETWATYKSSLGKLSKPLSDGRRIQSSIDKPFFSIYLHKSKDFHLRTRAISIVPYDGMVYCCETPNHTLLVKRGERMVWCGNSGDSHMANSLMGDVRSYYQTRPPSKGMWAALDQWAERADKYIQQNIGYVPGICYHYWHGKMRERQYVTKWDIICEHDFDPATDIYTGVNGLYQWTGNKKQLEYDLRRASIMRNEDSIDL